MTTIRFLLNHVPYGPDSQLQPLIYAFSPLAFIVDS